MSTHNPGSLYFGMLNLFILVTRENDLLDSIKCSTTNQKVKPCSSFCNQSHIKLDFIHVVNLVVDIHSLINNNINLIAAIFQYEHIISYLYKMLKKSKGPSAHTDQYLK